MSNFSRRQLRQIVTDGAGNKTAAPTRKVVAMAITSIGLAVVVAVLSAVTPEMLSPLGSWGTLIYAGIVALGGSLAGYFVKNGEVS